MCMLLYYNIQYVHVYYVDCNYYYYWFIFPRQFSHAQNSSPEPSLRSMPSTASEFTYDSRSPPDSLRYRYTLGTCMYMYNLMK